MSIGSQPSSLPAAVYAQFKRDTMSDTAIRHLNGIAFRCAGVSNDTINFRYTSTNIEQARSKGWLKDFIGLARFLAIVTELRQTVELYFNGGGMGAETYATLSLYLEALDNTIYAAGQRYSFDPTESKLTPEQEFHKFMLFGPD